jgi:hypothetical protein
MPNSARDNCRGTACAMAVLLRQTGERERWRPRFEIDDMGSWRASHNILARVHRRLGETPTVAGLRHLPRGREEASYDPRVC